MLNLILAIHFLPSGKINLLDKESKMHYLLTMNRRRFLELFGISGASLPFIGKLKISETPQIIHTPPSLPEKAGLICAEVTGPEGQLIIKMGRRILAKSKNFTIELKTDRIDASWNNDEPIYLPGKTTAIITANQVGWKALNLPFSNPLPLNFLVKIKRQSFAMTGETWLQSTSYHLDKLYCNARFLILSPKIKYL